MRIFVLLLLIAGTQGFSQVKLDEVMTRRQMRQTGIDTLNYSQKAALEEWLNDRFVVKEGAEIKSDDDLFLSLNIAEGAYLELSDGRTYEIDPDDRIFSAFWITPFPVTLSQSGNNEYPIKITNLNSGTSVNGREVSTRELLKKQKEKHAQEPTLQAPQAQPTQPETKQTPQSKTTKPETKQPKPTQSQEATTQ